MLFDRKQELLHLIMVYREDREIMTTSLPRHCPVSQNKQGPSLSRFLDKFLASSSSSTCYLYSPPLYHPKTEPMM